MTVSIRYASLVRLSSRARRCLRVKLTLLRSWLMTLYLTWRILKLKWLTSYSRFAFRILPTRSRRWVIISGSSTRSSLTCLLRKSRTTVRLKRLRLAFRMLTLILVRLLRNRLLARNLRMLLLRVSLRTLVSWLSGDCRSVVTGNT